MKTMFISKRQKIVAIILVVMIYPLGEAWRLWENGYFNNYSTVWMRINPVDAVHPKGIYCMEMKWLIKKLGDNAAWIFISLAGLTLTWRDNILALVFSECVVYRAYDLGLWFYNSKTDFYFTNFLCIGLADVFLWYFLILKKRAKIRTV